MPGPTKQLVDQSLAPVLGAESRFGRYADDAVLQCVTERQASALVAARLGKDGTHRAGCA